MTEDEMKTIAAADNATVTFINLLVTFLETRGLITRADFNGFVDEAIEAWHAEDMDPRLLKLIEIKARGFVTGGPPPALN